MRFDGCSDMIWFHFISFHFDMSCVDMVRFDLIWFKLTWFDLIWYDMIWLDLTWFDRLPLQLPDDRMLGSLLFFPVLYCTVLFCSVAFCNLFAYLNLVKMSNWSPAKCPMSNARFRWKILFFPFLLQLSQSAFFDESDSEIQSIYERWASWWMQCSSQPWNLLSILVLIRIISVLCRMSVIL